MTDLLQIVGAVLILSAFGAAQLGRLSSASITYLILNLVGAALLCLLASLDGDWGFVLLEGVWALVSLVSLVARLRNPAAAQVGARAGGPSSSDGGGEQAT